MSREELRFSWGFIRIWVQIKLRILEINQTPVAEFPGSTKHFEMLRLLKCDLGVIIEGPSKLQVSGNHVGGKTWLIDMRASCCCPAWTSGYTRNWSTASKTPNWLSIPSRKSGKRAKDSDWTASAVWLIEMSEHPTDGCKTSRGLAMCASDHIQIKKCYIIFLRKCDLILLAKTQMYLFYSQ